MQIIYKDKKGSSGSIKNGEIVLSISSRLSPAEQQRHIRVLSAKLQAKITQAPGLTTAGIPEGYTPSPVKDDAALEAWAKELNAKHFGFAMGKVRFRKQESRWGSCSGGTRNIQISERLRGGPHELLEYVLIHELAHLGELNHSKRFWALVARACPDYRQRHDATQRWGHALAMKDF